MILRGWSKSKLRFPLYIVGDTSTKYFSSVLQVYGKENVHFLGPIFDLEELDSLRTNCDIYLHGHSVGGTNPSLLEALVYCSGKLLCHDNEFNREVAQDSASYFSCEDDLSALLSATSEKRSLNSPWFRGPFEEDEVARKYFELLVED
jgi:glycosyltransferase involved in cell wall biosynthesis